MILELINCWPKTKIDVQIHKLNKTDCRLFNKRLTIFGQKPRKIFGKLIFGCILDANSSPIS